MLKPWQLARAPVDVAVAPTTPIDTGARSSHGRRADPSWARTD